MKKLIIVLLIFSTQMIDAMPRPIVRTPPDPSPFEQWILSLKYPLTKGVIVPISTPHHPMIVTVANQEPFWTGVRWYSAGDKGFVPRSTSVVIISKLPKEDTYLVRYEDAPSEASVAQGMLPDGAIFYARGLELRQCLDRAKSMTPEAIKQREENERARKVIEAYHRDKQK